MKKEQILHSELSSYIIYCGTRYRVCVYCIYVFVMCFLALTIADAVLAECTQTQWNIKINMTLLWKLYPNSEVRNIFLSKSNCTGEVIGDQMVFMNTLTSCDTNLKVTEISGTFSRLLKHRFIQYQPNDQFTYFVTVYIYVSK